MTIPLTTSIPLHEDNLKYLNQKYEHTLMRCSQEEVHLLQRWGLRVLAKVILCLEKKMRLEVWY